MTIIWIFVPGAPIGTGTIMGLLDAWSNGEKGLGQLMTSTQYLDRDCLMIRESTIAELSQQDCGI